MTQIRFKIDPDRITLNDQIALEDLKLATARELRDLLARFLTDEKGEFIEQKQARLIVGELTQTQQVTALTAFQAAMEEAGRAMLPKET
jgi:hypothetical protein